MRGSGWVEPFEVFVGGFDDVTEGVDSSYSFEFFFLVEAEGWSHVDVVGDGLVMALCFGPFFDDQVAWFHGHGEAAELDGFCF